MIDQKKDEDVSLLLVLLLLVVQRSVQFMAVRSSLLLSCEEEVPVSVKSS